MDQSERFTSTRATKIERYNEAKMERTDDDERIRTNQAKRQAHFFKSERDLLQEKVTRKLEIIPGEIFPDIEPEIVDIPDLDSVEDDYVEMAKSWSADVMQKRAINEV